METEAVWLRSVILLERYGLFKVIVTSCVRLPCYDSQDGSNRPETMGARSTCVSNQRSTTRGGKAVGVDPLRARPRRHISLTHSHIHTHTHTDRGTHTRGGCLHGAALGEELGRPKQHRGGRPRTFQPCFHHLALCRGRLCQEIYVLTISSLYSLPTAVTHVPLKFLVGSTRVGFEALEIQRLERIGLVL